MINFGTMVRELRERAGLGANEIARGIVSAAELSKLENGEKEADYIVWEALFERMGKSVDKLEATVSGSYYTVLLIQEEIEESLAERDYEAVRIYLDAYAEYRDAERGVHRQYRLMAEAVCRFLERGDLAGAQKLLEQAIVITFPDWKGQTWGTNRLCMQEIRLLCLISYVKMQSGGSGLRDCAALAQQIRTYIQKYLPDGEERAKIYPQTLFLLGTAQLSLGKTEEAYQSAEQGIRCLSENGVLTMMDKLLELKEKCQRKTGREEEKTQCTKYREAIRYLYQMAEVEPERDMAALLMQGSCQKEYMVSNEMLRELRTAQGVTQETLSEDICAQETLARIETGKSNPNKRNFRKLMEKLGARGSLFYGYIVSEHYEPYELVRFYNRCKQKGEYQEARWLLMEIEKEIDLSIPENRQYKESEEMFFQLVEKKHTYEEAAEKFKTLLFITMPIIVGQPMVYRMPHRQEVCLINVIALCYKHSGKVREALNIYEEMLERYERSVTLMKHHAVPGFLIYANYAAALEVYGELNKSCEIAKIGLQHSIRCGRGDTVLGILTNLSCVHEKRKETELQRKDLKTAMALSDLYENGRIRQICQSEYNKKFT